MVRNSISEKMKKHALCALALASALSLGAKNDVDPVLVRVAGKAVPLSEFEYLYHKNNSQQLELLTPEQYLQMFVDYKLKVADAEAAGLDTTATFRGEFLQYRDELAKPYLRDNSVADSLVAEAYGHYGDAVTVSHIMLPLTPAGHAAADSLFAAIRGGASFEALASERSIDQPSAVRGGLMGPVTPGRFPWAFEKAAYDTPVGGVSEPVNSGFGWHLIRVESRRPSDGEVKAAHILRLTGGRGGDSPERQKELIDSIYEAARTGSDFGELARQFSQDPGSGRKGGDLGWFGRGVMVQPFDSVAFALSDGAVSEPFETQFGWHIIFKEASRKGRSLDEMRREIEKAMERDDRATAPERVFASRAVAARGGRVNGAAVAAIEAAVAAAADGTALDSLLLSPALAGMTAYELEGGRGTVGQAAGRVAGVVVSDLDRGIARVAAEQALEAALTEAALDMARADLMVTNTDYRNLMNEYRDGILLFEVANNKVWERASRDTEGLEAFFRDHRERYAWDVPHFKSYVIFAATDAKVDEALAYAATLDASDRQGFTEAMRKRFGKDVKVERVLAAKGDNPITDYLAFGGEKPAPKSKQWACYGVWDAKVVDAPENAADVRAAVVADYQTALEKAWLDELHAKYPVKVNKKVLRKLK